MFTECISKLRSVPSGQLLFSWLPQFPTTLKSVRRSPQSPSQVNPPQWRSRACAPWLRVLLANS